MNELHVENLKDNHNLLEVKDMVVSFSLGSLWSPQVIIPVNQVSFSIANNEVLALVGESGSGKSTIARTLVRIQKMSSGKVFFENKDVTRLSGQNLKRYRQKIQMIFQDPYGSLNPVKNIKDQLERPILLSKSRAHKIADLLDAVGLPISVQYRLPYELSGGQRQRVGIARALAMGPRLLVADEPISMLDVSIRASILSLMTSLRKGFGLTYLYITHDLASARYFADRIMVIYGGRIVEVASSRDIVRNPVHPYTRLLLAATPNRSSFNNDLSEIEHRSPDITNRQKGCPFAPQCELVVAECREKFPPWEWISSDHGVSCYRT